VSGYCGYHLFADLGEDEHWRPGMNAATCLQRNSRHKVDAKDPELRIPVEKCGCGFWSYREFEGLLDGWARKTATARVSGSAGLYGFSPADHAAGVAVIGLVECFGRVIEGERGYRSAKARIVELYDDDGDPGIARVAAEFGVPVVGYPWRSVTGWTEIQERPGLPSRVRVCNVEETVDFFVNPGSRLFERIERVSVATFLYRLVGVGEARVPTIVRVEEEWS